MGVLTEDTIQRARSELPSGTNLNHCMECDAAILVARRKAIPGMRLCVNCHSEIDKERVSRSGYNRRGSKDSQLR